MGSTNIWFLSLLVHTITITIVCDALYYVHSKEAAPAIYGSNFSHFVLSVPGKHNIIHEVKCIYLYEFLILYSHFNFAGSCMQYPMHSETWSNTAARNF